MPRAGQTFPDGYAVLKCFIELQCWYCRKFFVRQFNQKDLTRPVYCDRKCTINDCRYTPKACHVCQTVFIPTSSHQKRCTECGPLYTKMQEAEYKSAHRKTRPWCRLVESAKAVAKRKGLPFNLTSDYVKSIWNERCPMLGIRLERMNVFGRKCDSAPSLDRIRPILGYVEGNVQIISWRANRIKNDATPEELWQIARYLKKIGV